MRRIDRYLLSEMCIPALIGMVMILMLLIGNVLYMLLRVLYQVKAPALEIAQILLYSMPGVLLQAVPAALLLGTSLALSRLVREREFLAMRMTGAPFARLVLPYLMVGVFSAVALFLVQEHVIPKTARKANELRYKMAMVSPVSIVPRDTVFRVNSSFLYVRDVDAASGTLKGVIVCKQETDGMYSWATIPIAENRDGRWIFRADPVTGTKPQMVYFDKQGEPKMAMIVDGQHNMLDFTDDLWQYMSSPPTSPEELTFKQMSDLAHKVRGAWTNIGGGFSLTPQQLTFFMHNKLALPLGALVAVLIAVPLSVRFGFSGSYIGLLMSMLVAFFFVISQQWSQVLALKADPVLNPVFAAWTPDTVFGLLGLLLFVREK